MGLLGEDRGEDGDAWKALVKVEDVDGLEIVDGAATSEDRDAHFNPLVPAIKSYNTAKPRHAPPEEAVRAGW